MDSRGARNAISSRGFTRWAFAHSQALFLFFFLALLAAVVFWFFAFFVPEKREEAIGEWRRDLSVVADTRRDLLDRRILEETAQASFVATFPTVRALVSPVGREGSGEGSSVHVEGILTDFRNIYGERSVSIRDAAGAPLVSSGDPATGAESVSLAREAMRSGKPQVDLVREPDSVVAFAVAAPVATTGAVLVVGDAKEVFDLLERPVSTGRSGEVLLVRREQESILYLSPLLYRKDPPLTFRQPYETLDPATRAALAGEDSFSASADYRGVRVLEATRRLKRAPWGLVVKMDEDEALAAFREDVLRRGLGWGGLLLALIAAAFGFRRAQIASHAATLARREEEEIRAREGELKESEERFRALIEGAPVAISVSRDGIGLYGNEKLAQVLGLRGPDEWIGRPIPEAFAPQSREESRERTRRRGLGLPVPAEFESVGLRPDGSEFPFHAAISSIQLPNGPANVAFITDTTERKRSEANVVRLNAELEEALAWQRQIFEGSRDAVFVSDEKGRFVAVNGAATELTGYSHEELLGMGIPDLHDEPDLAAYRAFHQRILGGEQILSEAPIKKKDGRKVAVEFNNRLVTLGGRRFMHTAGRDLTERRQLEAQLVQAQKMEAVGRLAGGVAHDFNNLLTVIQGYGELVRDSLPGDPRRESMDELLKAAGRAAALTRQLLAFSRKQVLEPKVVHLAEIVHETGRMLERLIGEHIALSLVAPEERATVKADPGQIEQVILNLAVNARDSMPNGGHLTVSVGSLTTATQLEGFPDQLPAGRWVLMTMEDTGCGMDVETLSHAFEPFFTTKERGKGTGLGLSTVYGIVRQSDGRVQVTSVPGKGTTIQVYLPRSDEKTSSGVRPSVGSSRGTETVLVVEDEAAVRNLVRAVLERKGYVVLLAQDGAAALDLVDKHTGIIHVLLTDVVMPGMNGRDLAARVRAKRPAIKVVFMSGYTADVPAELGVEGGPGFLSKPFNERALTAKLREVLDAQPA